MEFKLKTNKIPAEAIQPAAEPKPEAPAAPAPAVPTPETKPTPPKPAPAAKAAPKPAPAAPVASGEVVKRGRGRPRKDGTPAQPIAPEDKKPEAKPAVLKPAAPKPAPKPTAPKPMAKSEGSKPPAVAAEGVVKRGRGRPRKDGTPAQPVGPKPAAKPAAAKPAIPAKSVTIPTGEPSGRALPHSLAKLKTLAFQSDTLNLEMGYIEYLKNHKMVISALSRMPNIHILVTYVAGGKRTEMCVISSP